MSEETKAAPLSPDAEACLREWDKLFSVSGETINYDFSNRLPLRDLIEKTLRDQAAKIAEQSAKIAANTQRITELEATKPAEFEAWKDNPANSLIPLWAVPDSTGYWTANGNKNPPSEWNYNPEQFSKSVYCIPLSGEELERCRVSFEGRDRSKGPKDNLMDNPKFKAAIENAAKWGEESIRLRSELQALQASTTTRILGLEYDLRVAKSRIEMGDSMMAALAKNRDELADKLAKPSPEASELLAELQDLHDMFNWNDDWDDDPVKAAWKNLRKKLSRFVPEKREVSASVTEALKKFNSLMLYCNPENEESGLMEEMRQAIRDIVPPKPETPAKVKEVIGEVDKLKTAMVGVLTAHNYSKHLTQLNNISEMLSRLELPELPPGRWVRGTLYSGGLVGEEASWVESFQFPGGPGIKITRAFIPDPVLPKPARTKAEIAMLAMEHRQNPNKDAAWVAQTNAYDAEFLEAKS